MSRSARSPARSASPASGPARRRGGSWRPASAWHRRAQQALQDAIPRYLADAVKEHDVDIIAPPEVDITAGEEDGPGRLRCHRRGAPAGLRARLRRAAGRAAAGRPPPTTRSRRRSTAELRRHGSLTDVDRPAAAGDYLTLDVEAERDGEPVPGLNTEDWLYELGRGWVAPDFDERLTGAEAGEALSFTTTPERHGGSGRLHRGGQEGADAGAARADGRVGRREPRRVRDGRRVAGRHPGAHRRRPG